MSSNDIHTSSEAPRIRRQPVTDASAWDAQTWRSVGTWARELSGQQIDAIDRAIRALRAAGLTLETVRPTDLQLPELDDLLHELVELDIARRGFGMIRGLPVERYSDAECGMFFWALGGKMGQAVSQNGAGDRLGSVRSQGLDYDALNVRGYQTQAHLPFHCDPSDVVGLLCINQARSGGLSSVVSGMSMYNRILRDNPAHLPMLYRGFEYDRRGEEAAWQPPISNPVPVFREVEGELSIRYVRKSMETARQKTGQPFSAAELEVLDNMEALSRSPELVYSMQLEPGDMQFCNNYLVLHSRTAYEDFDEPARRRHLMRLWLKVPGIRKLDDQFIEYEADTGWSRREGILPRGAGKPNEQGDAARTAPTRATPLAAGV